MLYELSTSLNLFINIQKKHTFSGTVLLSGQKFPNKTLEVTMSAIVHLGDKVKAVAASTPEDQFCVGHNAYCQVSILYVYLKPHSINAKYLPSDFFSFLVNYCIFVTMFLSILVSMGKIFE